MDVDPGHASSEGKVVLFRCRLFLALAVLGLSGCGGAYYFVPLSAGYDPRSSLLHALPAIELRPGETRKGMVATERLIGRHSQGLVSEDPRIVLIWKPQKTGDLVHLQAIAPGTTLVHGGDFPFEHWDPNKNLLERTAWRWSLRKFLSPNPTDAEFRAMSDADLWKTVVRSRSAGALRVIVEQDRLEFWPSR